MFWVFRLLRKPFEEVLAFEYKEPWILTAGATGVFVVRQEEVVDKELNRVRVQPAALIRESLSILTKLFCPKFFHSLLFLKRKYTY